jgi:hypothetical protein
MRGNLHLSIELNRGIGGLVFGALPSEAESYLGPPDTSDRPPIPTHASLSWQYCNLGLGVFFHTGEGITEAWRPGDPLRAIIFTASGRKLSLWGEPIIGLREGAVIGLLRAHGQRHFRELEKSGYPQEMQADVKILRFEDVNLDLHFRNGLLQNCQWGVPLKASPFSYCFP